MTEKMPCNITDGPDYDEDELTGVCHIHQMAFTDWCEACEEDRQIEARIQRERDAGDETVEVIGDIADTLSRYREIGGL